MFSLSVNIKISRRWCMKCFKPAGSTDEHYHRLYPYYAEVYALTEIRKKPGFGVPLHSGIGGHSVLYLNGVCLDPRTTYPVLTMCDPNALPERQGVGVSVNSHFKNANWIAVEGKDFLWHGAREPGEHLSAAVYERTQHRAKEMGILDCIEFHDELFRAKPNGMSERDYKYEISIATDYAVNFGRDIYQARIPLNRSRMAAVVDFLNVLNSPYREGKRVYRWRVLNDNCSHVTHNALACAGIWSPWPTGQSPLIAAFGFPVPKNEFVDLMLRTNDFPIADAKAVYNDPSARRALLDGNSLPTAPGALASASSAVVSNDLYLTERLRLIFYDSPFFGPYRAQLARIFREARYSDLRENLRHFVGLYQEARAINRALRHCQRGKFDSSTFDEWTQFCLRYDCYIEAEWTKVMGYLAGLDQPRTIRFDVSP
jgi:hypothetical protein